MSIDPAFASYLAIALRLSPASARRDLAGKLPHQVDAGCAAVAADVVRRLQLAGWTITPAPPKPPDMGR